MTVDGAFNITARSTVIVGRIERGVVRVGDRADLVTNDGTRRPVLIRGIDFACPPIDRSMPRDPDLIGLLLEPDVSKAELADTVALEAR